MSGPPDGPRAGRSATAQRARPAPKVGLITYEDKPDLTADDRLLADGLEAAGVAASIPAIWSDRTIDWADFDALIMRSPWDYFHRIAEFRAWLDEAAKVTRIFNDARTILWNMEKTYLADLHSAGIATIPTFFISQSAPQDVVALCAERGWEDVVIKPTISGSAFGARRFRLKTAREDARAHAGRFLAERNIMVQPYLAEVESTRERALVYLGGAFSHAVRKAPFYTKTEPLPEAELNHTASDEEVAFGNTVLAASGHDVAYARVDIVPTAAGLQLMELELIEPALFFGRGPLGLARLVARITESLRT